MSSRYGGADDSLRAAMVEMAVRGLKVLARSSIWLSAPVPVSDQPWYRNAVVSVETDMAVADVMGILQDIEQDFGRVRVAGQRNAPRVLDLDLLAYHDEIHEMEGVSVPHPRMHGRAFVLYPLQEVAPGWIHPLLRRSVIDLIAGLPADQSIKRAA